MRIRLLATAALGLTAALSPAHGATAFGSFNGTNGNGGFWYGFTDSTTLSEFDTSGTGGSCFLVNGSGTCLYDGDTGPLPGAQVGGSWTTVAYDGTRVVVHPGNAASQSVYAAFRAATAGTYSYSIGLESIGIDTTNGTGYTFFTGTTTASLGTRQLLPTFGSTGSLNGTIALAAGQQFGVIVDYNGIYYGDTTALTFSADAVPEPATWAMLMLGFGLVGAAARRRRPAMVAA